MSLYGEVAHSRVRFVALRLERDVAIGSVSVVLERPIRTAKCFTAIVSAVHLVPFATY